MRQRNNTISGKWLTWQHSNRPCRHHAADLNSLLQTKYEMKCLSWLFQRDSFQKRRLVVCSHHLNQKQLFFQQIIFITVLNCRPLYFLGKLSCYMCSLDTVTFTSHPTLMVVEWRIYLSTISSVYTYLFSVKCGEGSNRKHFSHTHVSLCVCVLFKSAVADVKRHSGHLSNTDSVTSSHRSTQHWDDAGGGGGSLSLGVFSRVLQLQAFVQ